MNRSTPDVIKCTLCGKPVSERYQPFCSKRCADVDLHRWLSGQYAVPVVEEDGSASDEQGAADDGR